MESMESRGIGDAEGGVFDEGLYGEDDYVRGWALAAMDQAKYELEDEDFEDIHEVYRDDAEHAATTWASFSGPVMPVGTQSAQGMHSPGRELREALWRMHLLEPDGFDDASSRK